MLACAQRAPGEGCVLQRAVPRVFLRQIHPGAGLQGLRRGSARRRGVILFSEQAAKLSAKQYLSVADALRVVKRRSRARVVRLPSRTAALYVPNYEAQSGEPVEPDKTMPCPAMVLLNTIYIFSPLLLNSSFIKF